MVEKHLFSLHLAGVLSQRKMMVARMVVAVPTMVIVSACGVVATVMKIVVVAEVVGWARAMQPEIRARACVVVAAWGPSRAIIID